MKTVDSDALGTITAALGITGRGSQITEFLDGQLDQTFDVATAIRRGRTLSPSGGLFTAIMRNVHPSGASTITTVVDPFVFGAPRAPYPTPLPTRLFDLWLINATVERVSGTGTLVSVLSVLNDGAHLGWGIDNGGNPITGDTFFPVAFWDSVATVGTRVFGITEAGHSVVYPGLRLRPGTDLVFISTSSATETDQCLLTLGLFPIGLGQDLLVR